MGKINRRAFMGKAVAFLGLGASAARFRLPPGMNPADHAALADNTTEMLRAFGVDPARARKLAAALDKLDFRGSATSEEIEAMYDISRVDVKRMRTSQLIKIVEGRRIV